MKKINVASLFSGCGGMDLGFEGGFTVLHRSVNHLINSHWDITPQPHGRVKLPKTRFNTIFANDINENAQIAWQNYFSGRGADPSIYNLESIVNLVKQHNEGTFEFPAGIDIVTGGFPCQDFSIAGKRKGFESHKGHHGKTLLNDDEPNIESRGMLYYWMREMIRITEPKVFVAENVKGLINLDDAKDIIQRDFSQINDNGYLVISPQVLHSGNFGVPQKRERVIFLGFKRSSLRPEALEALSKNVIPAEFYPYPTPTHYITDNEHEQNPDLAHFVTVMEALEGLNEPEIEQFDLSQKNYSKAKYMGAHCQGQTELDPFGLSPTIRSEHHGNIEYRRKSLENGGKLIHELDRGLPERRLTVRECARLQTFPDDYEFVFHKKHSLRKGLSGSNAYKVIGNAVPPLLGYHLAKRLEDIWSILFEEDSNG